MTDLNVLVGEVSAAAAANGWHERYHKISDFTEMVEHVTAKTMLVVSELSEAVEELRVCDTISGVYYGDDGKPEGFPVELADALIRILDLAGLLGLDLESLVAEKLSYNATRGRMHGGKRL